jgi:hypothetical protein
MTENSAYKKLVRKVAYNCEIRYVHALRIVREINDKSLSHDELIAKVRERLEEENNG